MEAWIFPSSTTGQFSTWIMGKRLTESSDPYYLVMQGDGNQKNRITFYSSTSAAGSGRSITTPTAVPIAVWTHVAGVHEGTTLRLYINGAQVAQGSALGSPRTDSATPFSVGHGIRSNGQGAYSSFDGSVSQARFWGVARTAAQIAAGMNEGVPSEKTGLVAGWLLNEGTGLAAADYSGNNFPLQTQGANPPPISWVPTNGQSLDRVQTALHVTIVSPDSALQK